MTHMEVHSDQKRFECSFCKKKFKRKEKLKYHERIHTGICPVNWVMLLLYLLKFRNTFNDSPNGGTLIMFCIVSNRGIKVCIVKSLLVDKIWAEALLIGPQQLPWYYDASCAG